MRPCPVCVERQFNLGHPSDARWVGPDGGEYCSLHFIQAFGHGEPLVRIDYTEPPPEIEPPEEEPTTTPAPPPAASEVTA